MSRASAPSPMPGPSGSAAPSSSTGTGGGFATSVPATSLPTHSAGLGVSGPFQDRELLPPVRLLGDDRSKEKDEMFDVRLRGEAQLKRDLSPPNANSTTKDDLAANMVDVVSLPGTFSGSDETAGYDGTHQVAEVMREVMAQARGEAPGERVRVDSGWQHTRRISLHAIKSADQLQEQYSNLTDIAEEVLIPLCPKHPVHPSGGSLHGLCGGTVVPEWLLRSDCPGQPSLLHGSSPSLAQHLSCQGLGTGQLGLEVPCQQALDDSRSCWQSPCVPEQDLLLLAQWEAEQLGQ